MNLYDEISCEWVIISGLIVLLIGGVMRFVASKHPRKPDPHLPDMPEPTGGDRTSYITLLAGGFWTAYGVLRCLS